LNTNRDDIEITIVLLFEVAEISSHGEYSYYGSVFIQFYIGNNFVDTIFKFLHSIMFTLTLQISKLTKAVVLNSVPHGRLWQFVYKENVRCTRLMQHSLQVVYKFYIFDYVYILSICFSHSFHSYENILFIY
jgi:hypothetical protein